MPPADKFNAFPPEAQKALLEGFKVEQMQRHAWLRNQQHNDFQLNTLIQNNYLKWRLTGLICAALLALAVLAIGAILVAIGAPIVGVTLLIGAVGGLVGTAIYGHKVNSAKDVEQSEEE